MSRELFSLDAEHGVLGAMMLDVNLIDPITSRLSAADFYDEDNAALFIAILECHADGMPVDAVTVGVSHEFLPNGERLLPFAAEIVHNVPSAANWEAYANVVKERAVLRRVVEAADAVRASVEDDRPVAEIIASAQQAMADLQDLGSAEADYVHIRDVLPQAVDQIDGKFNRTLTRGHSTGLPDLDDLIQSAGPGHMIVVAGLPGSGKTTLGLQIAQHIACQNDAKGLVFSMEMTRLELANRSLASIGGVSLKRIDEGTSLEDSDWPALTAAVNKLTQSGLYLCDTPGLTAARIRAIARTVQRAHGLDVVVVDYIGLIASETRSQSRTIELGKISTAMKNLAKELRVPVIVLAQLNRDSTKRPGKRPMASDLRDSGQIEADADTVILVHRDSDTEQGQNGVTELIVPKCRHAKVGSCFVQHQGQYSRFVSFAGPREISQEEVDMGRSFAGRYKGGNHV